MFQNKYSLKFSKEASLVLVLKNFFGIHYIKILSKIQLVESIFDVIYAKIGFIGLIPGLMNVVLIRSSIYEIAVNFK